MKMQKIILSIILICFLFIGCSYDPVYVVNPNEGGQATNTNPANNNVNSFKVDIDGQSFVANTHQAIVNNTGIFITGIKTDGTFIQISWTGLPTVGTHKDNGTTSLGFVYSSGSGLDSYIGGSSFSNYSNYKDINELKISSIDTQNKIIKGTFQFTGGQVRTNNELFVKSFTKGEFTLSYTGDVPKTTEVPSTAKNTFSAKLDGVDFNPTHINAVKAAGKIMINGRRGTVESIGLFLSESVTSGTTSDLSSFGTNQGIYTIDASATGSMTGKGSVIITSHDTSKKRITGTFSFDASSLFTPSVKKSITSGSFDVTY